MPPSRRRRRRRVIVVRRVASPPSRRVAAAATRQQTTTDDKIGKCDVVAHGARRRCGNVRCDNAQGGAPPCASSRRR
eukprot:2976153-Prymnesium_polylepis.1